MRSLSRKCHREYIRKLQVLISDTSNHPSLHKFIRMQRSSGNSPGIPDLASNGKLAADPAALNEQFASLAVVDDPRIPLPSLDQHPCLPNAFRAPIITTAGVRKAIAKLKLNKSPGMDGISNEVVKALTPTLSYPSCLLFNLSFRKGKCPSAWKVAKITPIFKGKGSKATPGNYRPISLSHHAFQNYVNEYFMISCIAMLPLPFTLLSLAFVVETQLHCSWLALYRTLSEQEQKRCTRAFASSILQRRSTQCGIEVSWGSFKSYLTHRWSG